MKYVVIAVKDRAADVFGMPNYHHSIGTAIRAFGDEINRKAENNMFNAHPEDFDLFQMGTYDDNTGEFEKPEHLGGRPRQIAVGKDLHNKE